MDAGKLETELGVSPQVDFAKGLDLTVDWYLDNQDWCQRVLSGEYQDYYQRMYEQR